MKNRYQLQAEKEETATIEEFKVALTKKYSESHRLNTLKIKAITGMLGQNERIVALLATADLNKSNMSLKNIIENLNDGHFDYVEKELQKLQ